MNQYMTKAQRGIGKNTSRAKYQLYFDRTVACDFKARKPKLGTAWTDYKTAYNSVPHLDLGMSENPQG